MTISACDRAYGRCQRDPRCGRFCPQHPLVQPPNPTIGDRLAVLMARVREEHHQPTYRDLLWVQTGVRT